MLAWNRSGVKPGLPCPGAAGRALSVSDVVSLHLVLNEGTKGFINREKLGRMKPGAILVNTARGAVIDEGP